LVAVRLVVNTNTVYFPEILDSKLTCSVSSGMLNMADFHSLRWHVRSRWRMWFRHSKE